MVKILHITFNMGIGGTEQVIRQIINNSDVDRFQHEILCIDGNIGSLGQHLISNHGIHLESVKRNSGIDFKLARFISKYIKHRAINVLHCHQYTPYFYGVLGHFGTNARVIFTEHGRFFPDRHHPKRRFINPLLSMFTAHITAISRSTAEALSQYEYIHRDRIKVIYNGIKDLNDQRNDRNILLSKLGLSSEYRYIGTISRLEPIKNQTMMIKAFSMIRQKFPDLKLILIGDGEKMADLMQLTLSLEIEQDVIFTGFLDNPQLYISLFEIFLLSSFSEGTSMTLLEAMSLSRPCVVTDVGGNPEIVVNNETGLLTPSDNIDQFKASIIELLTDENKRDAYGQAGRERFLEKFVVDKMIDSYHELYLGN